MELKLIGYIRRSQDREDQQVLSIESQKRELELYAKKHNLNVVEYVCEDMSAYKRGRPKFSWMMGQIEQGKANGILCWHLTRIARNGADGGLVISFMDEGLIKEIRTTEKTYGNTGDDKFLMNIHFAMAKKSSDDTSAFVKNNLKTKLEKGEYPGWVPYGYLNIGSNGVISGRRFDREKQGMLEGLDRPLMRIEIDPVEGPLIRRLLEIALTGAYDLPMLQEEAEKLGIRGKLSGKKLAKESVRGILTNIFYTGRFNYMDGVHQGAHEPLMTSMEYERLQAILSRRSRPKRYKHEYTYASRVCCPECGELMSGEFQRDKHYYRCARAKGKNAMCNHKTHVRQDLLDEELNKELSSLVIPSSILEWALKLLKQSYLVENKFLAGKRVLLQKNINDEKAKLERLTSKWLSDSNADASLMSDEDYKERKIVIQENVLKFEEHLNDNGGEEDNWVTKCEEFFMNVREVGSSYSQADVIGKQILLQQLDAKFVRKAGNWAVELGEPFNCFLHPERAPNSIRTDYEPLVASKTVLTSKQLEWLPRSDSNRRPTD
jgi:site-specific DNA recombinase